MGLNDSICIITGGGSGIGRASALLMASEGAVVIAVGRTASKVEEARDEILSRRRQGGSLRRGRRRQGRRFRYGRRSAGQVRQG